MFVFLQLLPNLFLLLYIRVLLLRINQLRIYLLYLDCILVHFGFTAPATMSFSYEIRLVTSMYEYVYSASGGYLGVLPFHRYS